MAEPKDILRYLRECYRENGSRGGIWNFFGKSVQNRVFIGERDLFAVGIDNLDQGGNLYLREKEAGTTATNAFTYRKEKDLIFAVLFVTGWVDRFEGKPEAICAPLFLFPASVPNRSEFGAEFEIDLGARQINYAVLEAIGGDTLVRAIEESIEPAALTEGCIGQVRTVFSELVPGSATDPLLEYPNLITGRNLRGQYRDVAGDRTAAIGLEPAAAMALTNKSTEMRGVLNELEEMAKPEMELSPPVASLLGGRSRNVPTAPEGRVPAVLSASQQEILESARRQPITLAVGPPGTGKSFTIAALAIETLSRGGSVLIASKMDHAVDVVGAKIEDAIGLDGVVVRGGRREYLKDLKTFIEELLGGIHTAGAPQKKPVVEKERSLKRREHQIGRLKDRLASRLEKERGVGELLSLPSVGWFRRLRQAWVRRSVVRRAPLWRMAIDLEGLIDLQLRETVNWLGMVRTYRLAGHLRKGSRATFQDFLHALRARTGTRQESFFEKIWIGDLLSALPIWLVNLSDVHRVLPLVEEELPEGIFDLAIIDEATQCDMASALPVLQRAKRAVITGDPKQLRHLSFLPHARLRVLAGRFGLDAEERQQFNFRDVSLLDLVSDRIVEQSQVAFLNEHFRSRPEIIAFSNREFYGGKLHVMTGHREADREASPALRLEHVSSGFRGEGGFNEVEADAILEAVRRVTEEQSAFSADAVHSIGILSPFRDQVDYLRGRLGERSGGVTLMQRHDVLVGTSHSFQGEERDLMFLSFAVGNQAPAASFRFLEKPDVFNVAVTRARLLNHVFYSFDPGRLDPSSLLARYLAHAAASGAERAGESSGLEKDSHDRFAAEVAAFLEEDGAEVTLAYPLAGTVVDLVYTLDGMTRGIDLVGYPGSFGDSFPLERVLTFRRAGLQILPLPFAAWVCRREECETWLTGRRVQRSATRTRT